AFACRAVVLIDVALEQRTGVDVQAHSPRSSASASSMRTALRARRTLAGGGTRPGGAEIQPWLTPSSRRRAAGSGARSALGTPRSATRIVSPRATRARYRDSRCFSSRTPTSMGPHYTCDVDTSKPLARRLGPPAGLGFNAEHG